MRVIFGGSVEVQATALASGIGRRAGRISRLAEHPLRSSSLNAALVNDRGVKWVHYNFGQRTHRGNPSCILFIQGLSGSCSFAGGRRRGKRVVIRADRNITAFTPLERLAHVCLVLPEGSTLENSVRLPRGESDIGPLGDEEIQDRFLYQGVGVLDVEKITALM